MIILRVSGKEYEVDDISTSSELYLYAENADEAISIYIELRDMD